MDFTLFFAVYGLSLVFGLVFAEQLGGRAMAMLGVLFALYVAYRCRDRKRFIKSLDAGRISVGELSRMMDAGENPIVLDVRSRVHREADGRHIPGAVHVDLEALHVTLAGIPRDRNVIVYCACPNEVTAVKVAMQLRERGIRRVRPLLGGIDAWVSAGFEIEGV